MWDLKKIRKRQKQRIQMCLWCYTSENCLELLVHWHGMLDHQGKVAVDATKKMDS